jgi:hypothetical protein
MLTVVIALLLVGVVSGTILRHAVQVTPALVATVVVVRQPVWSRFAAIAVFAFWLLIMLLIWLYLLGLANVITGRFTLVEVILTIVIGLACVAGLAVTVGRPVRWSGLFACVMSGALQVGAMWLSLQPALANR